MTALKPNQPLVEACAVFSFSGHSYTSIIYISVAN